LEEVGREREYYSLSSLLLLSVVFIFTLVIVANNQLVFFFSTAIEDAVYRDTPRRWCASTRRRRVYKEKADKINELLDRIYRIEERFHQLGYHLPPLDYEAAKSYFRKKSRKA
jgi:hypothetical protein